ncbi:c-type cytochrome [Roseateles sp.]|uniref:c-type cytochrome n=1 Tax=Roseateles sp. TaxID=1971397 RepID=UPI00286D18C7|nr:c-type cytochrome [Roseateles sp.]
MQGNRLVLSSVVAALLSCSLAAAVAQTQPMPPVPAGRLLASNCFQCHGTNGKGPGFERLAGKSSLEVYKELKEMQAGGEGQGLMTKHALGYTDAQLRELSQWLSTQR